MFLIFTTLGLSVHAIEYCRSEVVTDSQSKIAFVKLTVISPSKTNKTYTLNDNGENCDTRAGDSTYSTFINLTENGYYNLIDEAQDTSGNPVVKSQEFKQLFLFVDFEMKYILTKENRKTELKFIYNNVPEKKNFLYNFVLGNQIIDRPQVFINGMPCQTCTELIEPSMSQYQVNMNLSKGSNEVSLKFTQDSKFYWKYPLHLGNLELFPLNYFYIIQKIDDKILTLVPEEGNIISKEKITFVPLEYYEMDLSKSGLKQIMFEPSKCLQHQDNPSLIDCTSTSFKNNILVQQFSESTDGNGYSLILQSPQSYVHKGYFYEFLMKPRTEFKQLFNITIIFLILILVTRFLRLINQFIEFISKITPFSNKYLKKPPVSPLKFWIYAYIMFNAFFIFLRDTVYKIPNMGNLNLLSIGFWLIFSLVIFSCAFIVEILIKRISLVYG